MTQRQELAALPAAGTPGLSEAEFVAIHRVVTATARGRAYLAEYLRRASGATALERRFAALAKLDDPLKPFG